jgi:STAS-like domain of unknown function (DUF4325)
MRTAEETRIRLAERCGPALVGRDQGRHLRAEVEEISHGSGIVTLDFDGVEVLSPGFADELFAMMPQELVESGHVRFENVDETFSSLRELVLRVGRE